MICHAPAAPWHGAHRYRLRIYYEDTDAGGVVYHANYLRFAERARTEALRDAGVPHAEMTGQHGLMFMVRCVKLDYLRPVRLDDSLLVVTTTLRLGAATVDLRQRFVHPDEAQTNEDLAVLELRLACVRLADQRPVRIPPRWREALRAMGG
ncbi:MAG: YbgC/FadM family acyl-CoA thioesterase [Rhodospirillales bacterium]|nr:YbgC/FadM family acyl-CoA thioesterase [Rhodospirillales bacterium]